MPATMVKTKTPGVYRRGNRYVVVYYVGGRQRKESARTYQEARSLKAARHADTARGEFDPATRLRFADYANEWVERYQGKGRGFREESRHAYRLLLKKYVLPYFDERLRRKLHEITPRDVAGFVGWLCEQRTPKRKRLNDGTTRKEMVPLSDGTLRKIMVPLQACLASAKREGLIRDNPARDAVLPVRDLPDEDGEEVRALTREQLRVVLSHVPARYRPLCRLLAATGLRISEAIALRWRDLVLDGENPHVRVRRRIVNGRVDRPKTRQSRRDVPLPAELVSELRTRRRDAEWSQADDLVFPNKAGNPLDVRNLRRRHLRPASEEAGVPWAGFHAFRHTCASMLFERGSNAKQVQRWLGHHSAAFTLATYVHLLSDDLGEPLDLGTELAPQGSPAPVRLAA